MKNHFLIVNFKTYVEGRGEKGVQLAKIADQVAKEYSAQIILVPQIVDMGKIAEIVDIPVYSQHVDPYKAGNATGHIDASSLKEAGIQGTLLNHSEKRLEITNIEAGNTIAKEYGLKTVICAGTIGISHAVSAFNPWAVAMEPPELIGGDVSVTTKPEVVKDAVAAIKKGSPSTIPLTGAGVKTADHVKSALEFGTFGVLLASGIVKAKNPSEIIGDMAKILVEY